MIHGPPPIVTPQSNTGGLFYAQTTMPTTTTTYGGQTSSFGDNQPTTTDYDDQPTTTSYSGSGNRVAVPSSEATGAGGWCPTTSSAAKCYRTAAEFPPTSQWMSLDCLINHSRPDMVGSSNDGPDEADDVIAAVQSVAQSAGIDARIPFALMMQESSGKVRPVIGDWGKSFGLFQVQIADAALCTGFAKNECPSSVIQNMVEEGIYGHNGTGSAPVAPGIAYWLGAEGGNVGRALRGYNTGRVDDPNDLTNIPSGGTKSYVSDVANRLIGGLLGAQHQYTCT
ncbi:MAG: hypothetical protein LQ350_000126 [Teloschistes chrysophthalmus]|nr:MAG: hypothetical protein LQ350_000126 [Niorma chrysophthalma]